MKGRRGTKRNAAKQGPVSSTGDTVSAPVCLPARKKSTLETGRKDNVLGTEQPRTPERQTNFSSDAMNYLAQPTIIRECLRMEDVEKEQLEMKRICEERIHFHENCERTEGQRPRYPSKGAPSVAHSTSKSHPEVNSMRNGELVRRVLRDVQESRRAKEVQSAVHSTYKGRPEGDRLSAVGQRQSGSSREVGSAEHSTSQQPERRDVDIVKPTSSRSCGRPPDKSRKQSERPSFSARARLQGARDAPNPQEFAERILTPRGAQSFQEQPRQSRGSYSQGYSSVSKGRCGQSINPGSQPLPECDNGDNMMAADEKLVLIGKLSKSQRNELDLRDKLKNRKLGFKICDMKNLDCT